MGLFSSNSDHEEYENEILNIEKYCNKKILKLNAKKTKEMIIDFAGERNK